MKKVDELTQPGTASQLQNANQGIIGQQSLIKVNESTAEFGGTSTVVIGDALKNIEKNDYDPHKLQNQVYQNTLTVPSIQVSPDNHKKSFMQIMDADRKWLQHVRKIYNAIYNMDKNKYLEPKFSTSLYPVIKYLHKKYGTGGSTISNLSMLSQSQRGGGPPLGTGSIINLANFNDSYSISSLLSGDTQLKKGSDISGNGAYSGINIPQSNSRLTMLVDDQKVGMEAGGQNQFSVVEQSMEDDEEEKTARIMNLKKSPLPKTLTSFTNEERSHSENVGKNQYIHNQIQMRLKEASPLSIEPVLKARNTSRTINGFSSNLLMNEALDSYLKEQPKFIENNSEANTSSVQYQDRLEKLKQRSSPKKQHIPKKKSQSRMGYQQFTSYNGGAYNANESQLLMENAYKTTYSQSNSKYPYIQKNINIQQNTAYGQFQPNAQKSSHQKKGKKFIKTLLERSTVQQQDSSSRNLADLNRDMQHVESSQTLQLPQKQLKSVQQEIDSLSPNTAIKQSYFNQSIPMNASSLMDNSMVNRSAIVGGGGHYEEQTSSRQYSAISVKRSSTIKPITEQKQNNSAFMDARRNMRSNIKKRNSFDKKLQPSSTSQKTGKRNQGDQFYTISSLAFDNVYQTQNQQTAYQQQPLTKIALQVISKNDNDAQADSQSNASHRSLQKNYLQNLNELVKIHQEMKNHKVQPRRVK